MNEPDVPFRDKLRTIQFAGKVPKPRPVVDRAADTKTTAVRADDEHGRVAGFQIEHGDGRVDATITPRPFRASMSIRNGEVTAQ